MFFTRNIYKKYKQVVFIDTENVGFTIPLDFSKENYYIFFCNMTSHKRGTSTGDLEFYCSFLPNTEIIDISDIIKKIGHEKNLLDFVLVTSIGERLEQIKDKEIVISSKDKGFLSTVAYIQAQYPDVNIRSDHYDICELKQPKEKVKKVDKKEKNENQEVKSTLSVKKYPDEWPEWLKLNLQKSSRGQLMNKYNKKKSFTEFYSSLNKSQKTKFYLTRGMVPIIDMPYGIRYDVYKKVYRVEFGFSFKDFIFTTADKDEAIKELTKTLSRMTKLATCFTSKEMFLRLQKLKLTAYVLEADSKNVPLLDILCSYMDYDKAIHLISQI